MEQESRYLINSESHRSEQVLILNSFILQDIDERLNELEYKTSREKKKPILNRAEKSAILFELGIMDKLLELDISQKKIAALLSLLLDSSAANIEKDLSTRYQENASFKKKETYKSLVGHFGKLELLDLQEKAEQTLLKLESK